MSKSNPRIYIYCPESGDEELQEQARLAQDELASLYPICARQEEADILLALGGDGFMLRVLREQLKSSGNVPIYGMNRGTVGFLMNEYRAEGLYERLNEASSLTLHPLKMRVVNQQGEVFTAHALNEVSLFRQTRQAAHIDITIDGKKRMDLLMCDGIMLATPAGSTAYNLSAHGPIIPLGSDLMALTPISPFRPRRWRGALLPSHAKVNFKVQNAKKRPVSAVADIIEFRDIHEVEITEDKSLSVTLLYDQEHNLEERIIREQFMD